MVRRINTDLANDLGNLAQRVLTQVARNCEGKVPAKGPLADADRALLDAAGALLARLRTEYREQQFHRALEAEWEVVTQANRYVDEQAPWALRKTDPARMATVLWVLAETIRHLAILVQPVMPDSASRLLDQLAVPADRRSFAHLDAANALQAGTPLPQPEGVFPRYVAEGETPQPGAKPPASPKPKPQKVKGAS
jgi:methionyl-tRNA synthetase